MSEQLNSSLEVLDVSDVSTASCEIFDDSSLQTFGTVLQSRNLLMLVKIQFLSALQNAQKQKLKYLTKALLLVSIAILMYVEFISFYNRDSRFNSRFFMPTSLIVFRVI